MYWNKKIKKDDHPTKQIWKNSTDCVTLVKLMSLRLQEVIENKSSHMGNIK